MAREMRDSGVEWIGEVPDCWDVLPLYILFNEVTKKNMNGEVTTALQFRYGTIVKKENFEATDTYVAETIKNYTVVEPGVIIINGLNLNYDFVSQRVAIVKDIGVITSAYIAISVKNENMLMSDYATYLLKAFDSCKAFHNMGGGVRKILNFNELKKEYFIVPTIKEQQDIVNRIKRKCDKIDSLSTDIQLQINLLEDYKKAVITETVTKGLNPDVEMKDSGIEWIGEIPKHWGTNRIKNMFRNGKGLPITKENLIYEGLAVVSYGQIHSKTNTGVMVADDMLRFVDFTYRKYYPQCQVYQYDFIFADTSEDSEGCGNCIYKRDSSELFAGYHTIILHSIVPQDNRYLAYLFKTDCWKKQIRETASGVKVFSITQKILKNSSVIVPPFEEQRKIADYLDKKCAEIDATISEKKEQLEVLEQYKKSLIYEYVTGKKEVCE